MNNDELKSTPLIAAFGLVELTNDQIELAKSKLADGTALKIREMGVKTYKHLCRHFGVQPFHEDKEKRKKEKRRLRLQEVFDQRQQELDQIKSELEELGKP